MKTILKKSSEKKFKFFATCASGFESLLEQELKELGASTELHRRGVSGEVSHALLYHLWRWSRLANRILIEIHHQRLKSALEDPYEIARKIEWHEHFHMDAPFACTTLTDDPKLPAQHFALRVKDAIADHFRKKFGDRPNVDRVNPMIEVFLHVSRNEVSVLLDVTGNPLHQRGYRKDQSEAPMRETVAAGIARWANAQEATVLYDPFCGSGTLIIESVLLAKGVAASSLLHFPGLEFWKDHAKPVWQKTLLEPARNSKFLKAFASDMNNKVLDIAQANIDRAGLKSAIQLEHKNAIEIVRPVEIEKKSGIILANLPYGERMASRENLSSLYRNFYLRVKSEFKNWKLVLISSDMDALNALQIKANAVLKFKNGPLRTEARLYIID